MKFSFAKTNTILMTLLVLQLFGCSTNDFFEKNQKVVFIGDSITQQGHFITFFQDFLEKEKPQLNLSLVNAGLNSETVSGLSEPIHDPPRPFLFTRLKEVLEKEKPDLVFFCYGINDGIYHPFSPDNFQKFQNGVQRFLDEMKKRNIKIVLMTPCPFNLDKKTEADLMAQNDKNYSWKNPYVNYDKDVIQMFREHILSIRHPMVKETIDLYQYLDKKRNIAFDKDPIHPNKKGHELIAEAIIQAVF